MTRDGVAVGHFLAKKRRSAKHQHAPLRLRRHVRCHPEPVHHVEIPAAEITQFGDVGNPAGYRFFRLGEKRAAKIVGIPVRRRLGRPEFPLGQMLRTQLGDPDPRAQLNQCKRQDDRTKHNPKVDQAWQETVPRCLLVLFQELGKRAETVRKASIKLASGISSHRQTGKQGTGACDSKNIRNPQALGGLSRQIEAAAIIASRCAPLAFCRRGGGQDP